MTMVTDANDPEGEIIELDSMNNYTRKVVPPLKVDGKIIKSYSYNFFPIILNNDGSPWREGVLYIIEKANNDFSYNLSTYHSIVSDLTHFKNYIDDNGIDKFMNNMIETIGNNNSFSYEDFKESIEEFIWRQLDHCFIVMKTIINEAVKPNFRAECDKLLSALSKNKKIIENGLLSEKIQLAKFNISEKLSDIENWFRRPSKELDEDIELATLLIASKDYIEGIYSPQKIKIELRHNEHDSLKLSNASLLNLTRSLVTMYNNCLRHGIDLVGTPISVTTTVIDSQLTISVENEISHDKRLELFKRNITDEVDSYPNNDYSDRLKMEGGTGLYKVFKNIQDGFKKSRFTVELNDKIFKQIIEINLE
ncbi:hypothetical protein DMP75_06480 [Klebsiella michiganensis]|nr:hypothetical protein DMP75_06480 [Klebsiella michiganensis]